MKFILHTRLPSLGRLIQLLLKIPQLSHRVVQSVCRNKAVVIRALSDRNVAS